MPTLAFGGNEYRMLAFSRHVDRTRFDHKIVCIRANDKRAGLRDFYLDAGAEIVDLHIGQTTPGKKKSLAWAARAARNMTAATDRFCRMVRDMRIDVIDAHSHFGSQLGVIAGRLTKTPVLVTTYHAEQWDPLALWYVVQQGTLAAANGIITDADATRDTISRWLLTSPNRMYVIPNGQDPPRATMTAEAVRQEYALPPPSEARIVAMFARMIPTKGHMVLLDAAQMVLRSNPSAFFIICGYEPTPSGYRERLIARSEELGISARVRLMGYPGAIGDIWQLTDVHVHPSLYDSLPNCIIEGMSLGKPAVVTDVGGIASLVANERSGLVVPPNNPHALADGILRLLRVGDFANRLGEAAHERYLERYTAPAMTRRIEEVFLENAVRR